MGTAPHLSMILEVAGSMARTPVSPQSMFTAQRPDTNMSRAPCWSRLISSGGPNSPAFCQMSSAADIAALLRSGSMLSPKNMPWDVPWVWMNGASTPLKCQVPTPLRAFGRQEP